MRRRSRIETINFFAFQDVMISFTGVVIVVSLLLLILRATGLDLPVVAAKTGLSDIPETTVEIRTRKFTGEDRARLAQQIEGIRFELDNLELALQDARADVWDAITAEQLSGDMIIVTELLRRRDELLDSIAQMNRRNKIVYLITDPDSRRPWVVEIRDDRVILSTDEREAVPISFRVDDPAASAERLLDFFESLPDRDSRYLLLSVKPSGVAVLKEVVSAIDRRKTISSDELGLDLIPEWAMTTDLFPGRER